jgi:hypothetical protein
LAAAEGKQVNPGDWSDEQTDDPLYADDRNFYKVEKWTRDGSKVDSLLYADNNLDKARAIFAQAIKHRPRIRLTIRQRARVLRQYPPARKATPNKQRPQRLSCCGPKVGMQFGRKKSHVLYHHLYFADDDRIPQVSSN